MGGKIRTRQHEQGEPVRSISSHGILQLPLMVNRPGRRVVRVGPPLRHQELATPGAEGRQVRADLVDDGAHALVDERDVCVPVEGIHIVGKVVKDHILQYRRREGVGQGAGCLLDELVLAAECEARVEAVSGGVARAVVDLLERGDLGCGEALGRVGCCWITCQCSNVEVADQGIFEEAVFDPIKFIAVVQHGALDEV